MDGEGDLDHEISHFIQVTKKVRTSTINGKLGERDIGKDLLQILMEMNK